MDATGDRHLADPQDLRIPAQVWEGTDMRGALATRNVSSVYRLLRKTGVSQRSIAAMTGQSQSEVSEVLKGRQVMAYDVLARIADGLGVPRGYMGLAYDTRTAIRVAAVVDDPQVEEDEAVKRRRFLAHAAAVTMGAAVMTDTSPGPSLAHASETPAPARIGMTDVRQVEAATRALRALDYQYGGGFCRDAVVAQLSWGQQMLTASTTDVVRGRLYVALADLHNLAGWTSFDMGMADAARNHFGRALELARSGGSDTLVANVLYRMGRVYLHQDAANEALKFFQLGQIAAQESGSELAVAVLCGNEAWAYAALGNAAQAQKLLGRMRDEFSRSDVANAESWVKFFDETDVHAMVGTVHSVLATTVHREHTQFAIPALHRCLARYDSGMARSKAFMLSALATNHLIDGEVEQGAKVGRAALEAGVPLKSKRVKDRMRPILAEADRRSNIPDARDLSEQLDHYLSA
jgi:transcriptional regulator with XRE-family HTH domain